MVEKSLREEGWPDCQYIKDWNQTLEERRKDRYENTLQQAYDRIERAEREVRSVKVQAAAIIALGATALIALEAVLISDGAYKEAAGGSLSILLGISVIVGGQIRQDFTKARKVRDTEREHYNYLTLETGSSEAAKM